MDACANHAGHQSFQPVRNSHSQDVQLLMKNSRRRVVITGLGVVAPNGIGKNAFWRNLVAGKSAVDTISAFDPTPFPSKVAAEVRDFHPTDFMRARDVKMMGRFTQFAVAAARLAIEDSGLRFDSSLAQNTS